MRLAEKIGKDVFVFRIYKILEDEFKAKNCNKLSYLRKEISAFIHSPMVQPKSTNSP
nr:MAG TPA: hypothetical protein [Caudoviricetes sp.]